MHYTCRETLMDNLNQIVSGADTDYSKWALICSGIGSTLYAIVLWQGLTLSYDNPDEWTTRITAKCGAEEMLGSYQYKSVVDSGTLNVGIFGYLGLLFSKRYFSDL